MAYQIDVITPVEVEPVTLEEVKNFMRIDEDYTADDPTIEVMITAARELLEKETGLALAETELLLKGWDGCKIILPYGPNQVLVDVKKGEDIEENYTFNSYTGSIYINSSGNDTSVFYDFNGLVELDFYPTETSDDYSVQYTCGYETLPAALKQAIMVQVDYMYKNTGIDGMGVMSPLALLVANKYSKNLIL